jgi:hypothetical protein
MEEIQSRHKKELKVLDGEKRSAIKKAKALKGQRGKEALARYATFLFGHSIFALVVVLVHWSHVQCLLL